MRKLIDIKGELNEKGSLVYTLSVMAVKDGKSLKIYIEDILENHIKTN